VFANNKLDWYSDSDDNGLQYLQDDVVVQDNLLQDDMVQGNGLQDDLLQDDLLQNGLPQDDFFQDDDNFDFLSYRNRGYAAANPVVGGVLLLVYLYFFRQHNLSENESRATFASNTRGEFRSKRAALEKTQKMIRNAKLLHTVTDTTKDNAHLLSALSSHGSSDFASINYGFHDWEREEIGGFFWTLRKLSQGELLAGEGIWLPTRLIVFQSLQAILTVLYCLVYAFLAFTLADLTEDDGYVNIGLPPSR